MERKRKHNLWNPSPLYFYKERWIQKLYSDGIKGKLDSSSKRWEEMTLSNRIAKFEGGDSVCYWSPVVKMQKQENTALPLAVISGFRLYGKECNKEGGDEFNPIIEVLHDNSSNCGYRLFSCKDFIIGDAVGFVSKSEDTGKNSILIGNYARITCDAEEANVHVTLNSLLRCTKPIKIGDEIIRNDKQEKAVDFFERMDRVVFCPDRQLVGRIGQEEMEGGKVMVHWADGSSQAAERNSGLGFGYTDSMAQR